MLEIALETEKLSIAWFIFDFFLKPAVSKSSILSFLKTINLEMASLVVPVLGETMERFSLIKELKKRKADDILVFCGGVIPKKDYQFLYDAGVSEIFGPGSSVIDAAHKVIENTTDHLKRMHNYRKSRIV